MFTLPDMPQDRALLELADRFSESEATSLRAFLAFLHVSAETYEAYNVHFARYGLSDGRFSLLIFLLTERERVLTPSDCAERLGVTRATVTGLLDGLEREGLIRREPRPGDGRMLAVRLTEQGQKLLEGMLPDHFRRITAFTSHLTEIEKMLLISLIVRLRAGLLALSER